ncbi:MULTISPECIES: hypothetical protein [unclassified Leeuwenhoekiella]|uniref:hypothetical protein n=1 Tax=unclassified Leeuwenhoekiella TaxID=2615029 RepID=UPI000C372254|nr:MULTISPECIES: hypothetical protein [unclassified Leeuwenhoekiella]MBA82551.1 hypothetical protein [Leeuwenhoekiella sp.]|tara:strand:- start:38311 stop:38682 length:372 start_codon:yes stop_codon:yes gene_type:complete
MILKTLEYPFGKGLLYDRYVHFIYPDDIKEVTPEYARMILKDVDSFYGNQKYVFISERGLDTRLDPEMLKGLNLSKMKALAIVSPEGPSRMEELIKEQEVFKGSFAFFTNFDAAKDWALTFLD